MIALRVWGMLGLAAVPVLVALSLWRWRRREVRVSSLLLWRDVAARWREAPKARRRRQADPLLLLRIAAALVLTAGLCGLAAMGPARRSRRLAIVVDRSASMAARRPDGRTRWEACRDELLTLLESLDPWDRVALAAVPPPAGSTLGSSLEPAAAATRLRSIAPCDAAVPPQELAAAAGAARTAADAVVLLATDARLEGLPRGVAVVAAGAPAANRGVVAFAAREGRDGRHEVLVRLANAGAEPSAATVLVLADGREVARRSLELAPRGRTEALFEADLGPAVVLEARLEGKDAMAGDDAAWLARRLRPTRIAWVGKPNYPLRRALAVQPGAEVADLPELPERAVPDGFHLAVYHRAVPRTLGGGIVAVVAPDGQVGRLRPGRLRAAGQALVVAPRDPLMAEVRLDAVALGRVAPAAGFDGFTPLARVGAGPVLGRWREDGTTVVYVGIDPEASPWPLDPSFPIFWANVVAAASGDAAVFGCIRPGERVGAPGGVLRPERVGRLEMPVGEGRRTVAVSLLSEAETMARGEHVAAPPGVLGKPLEHTEATEAWRLSGWMALAGLVLVLVHGPLAVRARGI